MGTLTVCIPSVYFLLYGSQLNTAPIAQFLTERRAQRNTPEYAWSGCNVQYSALQGVYA